MTEQPADSTAPRSMQDAFSTQDAMLSWVRDIAPYGIFTTDAALVIREWNQWLSTHSGLTADDVVGRPLLEVFPDIATRNLAQHFQRALRGEIAVLSTALHRYLVPLPSPNPEYGADCMLQTARIAPLPAHEEIVGTITIIEDVTQRECQAAILRRQQEYDRLLSDALALLLPTENPLQTVAELFPRIAAPLKLDVYFNFVLSPDGTELRLQTAAGVTPEVRRSMATLPVGREYCGEVARSRTPLVVTQVQDKASSVGDGVRRLGLRSYAGFPLLLGDRLLGTISFGSYARDSIAPDEVEFLGKLAQYVAIALDRAQRARALREAQERLSQHAGDLEVKIAERTAKLHETIVQLESFSYTVAHDLRAPIRSLNGFTAILLDDFSTALPAEARDMLGRLQRATHRLDALTRDLLKFSRVIRQDVQLAPVAVDDVIQDIVSVTPGLQLEILATRPPLGVVQAQRTLLQQCLSNLFDNALKFMRPGVAPRIVVRSEMRSGVPANVPASTTPPFQRSTAPTGTAAGGPSIRIWIEDNGIGIPPHAFEKIWGMFERVPGPTPVDGTGIGLAIVARAMQQMGGACGVESDFGTGSRFWLELPAAPA